MPYIVCDRPRVRQGHPAEANGAEMRGSVEKATEAELTRLPEDQRASPLAAVLLDLGAPAGCRAVTNADGQGRRSRTQVIAASGNRLTPRSRSAQPMSSP